MADPVASYPDSTLLPSGRMLKKRLRDDVKVFGENANGTILLRRIGPNGKAEFRLLQPDEAYGKMPPPSPTTIGGKAKALGEKIVNAPMAETLGLPHGTTQSGPQPDWRPDLIDVAEQAVPMAASMFLGPEAPLIAKTINPLKMLKSAIPALTVAGTVGNDLGERLKQNLGIGEGPTVAGDVMAGAVQGVGEGVFRGAPKVAKSLFRPFGTQAAIDALPAESRDLAEFAEDAGIGISRDDLSGKQSHKILRSIADRSMLSANIGKRFRQENADQLYKFWEGRLAPLNPKGRTTQQIGRDVEEAAGRGMDVWKNRIQGWYKEAETDSPNARVNFSDAQRYAVDRIRDLMDYARQNPNSAAVAKDQIAVLSKVLEKTPEYLERQFAKGKTTDQIMRGIWQNRPIANVQKIRTELMETSRNQNNPHLTDPAKALGAKVTDALYGQNAKLENASPKAMSLFNRARAGWRRLSEAENSDVVQRLGKNDPEFLASAIKPRNISDAKTLRVLVDKYARQRGVGSLPSPELQGLRFAVLQDMFANPDAVGKNVFSKIGTGMRRRGENVIQDLFSDDPIGQGILKNLQMTKLLMEREGSFNPSGTAGALVPFEQLNKMISLASMTLPAATLGERLREGKGERGVVEAGAELAAPVILAKIFYSPGATRALISGASMASRIGMERAVPFIARAIWMGLTEFDKLKNDMANQQQPKAAAAQ